MQIQPFLGSPGCLKVFGKHMQACPGLPEISFVNFGPNKIFLEKFILANFYPV